VSKIKKWWEVRAGEASAPAPLRFSAPSQLKVTVAGFAPSLQVHVVDPALTMGGYWRDVIGLRQAAAATSRTLDCDPHAILENLQRAIADDPTFVPAYRSLDEIFAQGWAGVGHELALYERSVGIPQPFGCLNSLTSSAMTAATLSLHEASLVACAQLIVRDSYAATRVRSDGPAAGPHQDSGSHHDDERLSLVRFRPPSMTSLRAWVERFPFDPREREMWFDHLGRAAFFGDARFLHAVTEANRALVEHGDAQVARSLDTSMA